MPWQNPKHLTDALAEAAREHDQQAAATVMLGEELLAAPQPALLAGRGDGRERRLGKRLQKEDAAQGRHAFHGLFRSS